MSDKKFGYMLAVANKKQRAFYEQFLYPLHDEVLNYIDMDKFYLTGGTCLSRYYFQHRYSDDLDFFFETY